MRNKLWIAAALAAGCVDEPAESTTEQGVVDPGRQLFDQETFGGNGRTCRTCHSPGNGTLTLDQIAERFAENPTGPLFRGDGTGRFQLAAAPCGTSIDPSGPQTTSTGPS